jgi:hypothetical protein
MDQPLVFLDVETANPRGAPHLVEVGAVRVVGGEAVGHFETLICPDVAIDPAATEVHGLTVDDLRAAPDPRAALEHKCSTACSRAARSSPFSMRAVRAERATARRTPSRPRNGIDDGTTTTPSSRTRGLPVCGVAASACSSRLRARRIPPGGPARAGPSPSVAR